MYKFTGQIAAAMTEATGIKWTWGGSLTGRSFYATIDINDDESISLRVADHGVSTGQTPDRGVVIDESEFDTEYSRSEFDRLSAIEQQTTDAGDMEEESRLMDSLADAECAIAREYDGEWDDECSTLVSFDRDACLQSYVAAAQLLAKPEKRGERK